MKLFHIKIFKFFKKPIVLSISVSLIIGLIAGAFSSIYLAPLLVEKLGLKTGEEKNIEESANKPESIADVVEKVSPAVVSIIVSKYVPILEREYYNPFGENSPFKILIPRIVEKGKELKEVGGGSGFIISSNGLVVTNKHVVYDTEAEYTVLTNDGKKYPAPVLARDPIQDVAILKISASNLPIVKFGDSDKLRIGQTVIAIGNALGEFRNTVSVGVISGLARTITASGGGMSEQLEEVIQTDAAINSGNSGGPLLNLNGEVIGINTAMAQGAENIAFAIPINKAKKDIVDVQTKGRISYPFLGARYVLINKAIQEQNKLSVDYGALIVRGDKTGETAITPNSPAEKAGLQEGDIILEINNQKIDQTNTLSKIILKYSPGQEITLKVLRNKEEKTIKVVLGEWKQ